MKYVFLTQSANQAIPDALRVCTPHATWESFLLPTFLTRPLWKRGHSRHLATIQPTLERLNALHVSALVTDDLVTLANLTLAELPHVPLVLLLPPTLSARTKRRLHSPLLRAACQLAIRMLAPNQEVWDAFCKATDWNATASAFLPEIILLREPLHLTREDDATRLLPANLERRLQQGRLPYLGGGHRRQCYRIPDEPLCIKCYRTHFDDLPNLKKTIRQEIARLRYDRRRNTSCQEYDYYRQIICHASPQIRDLFPAQLDLVYLPSTGWTLIEELLCHYDGRYVENCKDLIAASDDIALCHRLFDAVVALQPHLVREAIKLYDPQNILAQFTSPTTFRLRVTDFEPVNRSIFPIEEVIPALRRKKIKRRYDRFLGQCRWHLSKK